MDTVVFIGAGSMAEAVISGILDKSAIEPQNVYVMNKSDDERLISLQHQYGISIVCKDKEVLKKADLVVLATKPKDIHHAMADIRPLLTEQAAVLSVIAGVSIRDNRRRTWHKTSCTFHAKHIRDDRKIGNWSRDE